MLHEQSNLGLVRYLSEYSVIHRLLSKWLNQAFYSLNIVHLNWILVLLIFIQHPL